MSQNPGNPFGGKPVDPAGKPDQFTQDVQFSQATARVPEKVGRGVISTGALILQGQHEFVLDFLQRVSPPYHVVSRVVVPTHVMPGFIAALEENLGGYTRQFGPPPALPPVPPNQPVLSPEEIYAQFKLPDDMLGGSYANTVMIAHTPAEFCFDFITNTFPHSVVTSRVYLSSFHIPRLLESLRRSYEQFARRIQQQQQQQQLPPGAPGQKQGPG